MPDRILGILGGMGPEATADFYRQIIRLTPAERDQDHIPVIVVADPRVPERTRAILQGGEDPTPHLIQAATTLEKAGAHMLVMPCNTAHFYLDRIRQAVRIPMLDMIEETFRKIRNLAGSTTTVGLLATRGTVASGVYSKAFARHGVAISAPDAEDQQRVQEAIFQIKAGKYNPDRQDVFECIGAKLIDGGASALILGCTEIPLGFVETRVTYPVINATRVLAQAAVDWALGKRP